MNIQEAYAALGIEQGASKDDAKKAFKAKAKMLHPDNKETGSEDAFKKINEAHQIIENYDPNAPQPGFQQWGNVGGFDIADILSSMPGFAGFRNQNRAKPRPHKHDIHLTQTISFEENILGCTKDVKFACDIKCDICSGSGYKTLDNGCAMCGGKGTVISRQGFAIMQTTCPTCKGNVASQDCVDCSGFGSKPSSKSVSVNIPAGMANDKNTLKLGNIGHFISESMIGQASTNVYMTVNIEPQDGLSLDGNDVVTNISISLLEALQGVVKVVPTIDGDKDVIIPEGTRNKDNVVMLNLGVRRSGNERVIVSVEYPSDTKELVDFLKPKTVEPKVEETV
jgi:molecular chaperone DnaJ